MDMIWIYLRVLTFLPLEKSRTPDRALASSKFFTFNFGSTSSRAWSGITRPMMNHNHETIER